MSLASILILLVTVALMLLGVEIFVCLGIGAILFSLTSGAMPLENLGLVAFTGLDVFPLLALPLYILTGDLISEGGISKILVDFAKATVGWIRGGLVLTTLWAAEGFAAISGSNAATVAAMGRIMVPELEKDGYPVSFAAGSVACCGTVGIITPPSIILILYGVTSGVPVGDLFVAGIFPGLVMVIAMSTTAILLCYYKQIGTKTPFTFKNFLRRAWQAKLPFGATAIILGGIYGGIFTPTEAAAVAVAYCLLAGLFVTRKIKVRMLPQISESSAGVSGMIAPVIVMAMIFSENLTILRLPETGAEFLLGLSQNPTIIMAIIIVILLIAGCVMEAGPNVLILTSLLAPVATGMGYHPVHFGIIMIVTLAIGYVTPPFGMNLFVASSITNVETMRVALAAVPYVIALILGLTVIIVFPTLSTIFLTAH